MKKVKEFQMRIYNTYRIEYKINGYQSETFERGFDESNAVDNFNKRMEGNRDFVKMISIKFEETSCDNR